MARKNFTAAASKAVQSATNKTLLSRIARGSEKIEDLGYVSGPKNKVNTVDLAISILNNRRMRKTVDFLTKESQEEVIAGVLGSLIAASMIAKA